MCTNCYILRGLQPHIRILKLFSSDLWADSELRMEEIQKEAVAYFKSLNKNSPEETTENYEKLQLIWRAYGPRFETRTSNTEPNLYTLNLFHCCDVIMVRNRRSATRVSGRRRVSRSAVNRMHCEKEQAGVECVSTVFVSPPKKSATSMELSS
jgi:hypothetical protein